MNPRIILLLSFLFFQISNLYSRSFLEQQYSCQWSSKTINNDLLKESKLDAQRKISIKLESILPIFNDHVGNDWTHFLSIQKQVIKKGEIVIFTLKNRAPMLIEAHSIEEDADYPDAGKNSMDLIYSDLIAIDNNRFSIDVTVVENGGQYAGNIATWKFLFMMRRVV